MVKYHTTKLRVAILPSEVTSNLIPVIHSKLNKKIETYSPQHKYYIKTIENVTIPQYGFTSRANFVLSFDVSCTIGHLKPIVGDAISAVLHNKNQYGIFLTNEYARIIVPKSQYSETMQFEIGNEYNLRVVETRYNTNGISCICSVL